MIDGRQALLFSPSFLLLRVTNHSVGVHLETWEQRARSVSKNKTARGIGRPTPPLPLPSDRALRPRLSLSFPSQTPAAIAAQHNSFSG
jgi:hypothetical protein